MSFISGVPSGTVFDFAGSTAPTGWLLCYGQAVSRTTYADLYAAIGTTYGTGDGSTTFNLPDLRGRAVAGKDDMGGSAANRITSAGSGITGTTLGSSGGTQTHTLQTAELAAHTHANALTDNNHTHVSVSQTTFGSGNSAYSGGGGAAVGNTGPVFTTGTPSVAPMSLTNASAGSGNAHQNTQPTIILNKIIKT